MVTVKEAANTLSRRLEGSKDLIQEFSHYPLIPYPQLQGIMEDSRVYRKLKINQQETL